MAVIDAYRVADDCVCPRCFGIPHITEVWIMYGTTYRIENRCNVCRGVGRLPRSESQRFWLSQPATA